MDYWRASEDGLAHVGVVSKRPILEPVSVGSVIFRLLAILAAIYNRWLVRTLVLQLRRRPDVNGGDGVRRR